LPRIDIFGLKVRTHGRHLEKAPQIKIVYQKLRINETKWMGSGR
jgi:hypothetical protein